jgi:hypothetical protein
MREVIMIHSSKSGLDQDEPSIVSLGKAADLTLGSGEIETDFLGNTTTYYGKWINEPAGPVPAEEARA